jgi:hypothetical protein
MWSGTKNSIHSLSIALWTYLRNILVSAFRLEALYIETDRDNHAPIHRSIPARHEDPQTIRWSSARRWILLITERRWLSSTYLSGTVSHHRQSDCNPWTCWMSKMLPMGGEQLPRASKYQRVGSCLLLLRANPYFRALDWSAKRIPTHLPYSNYMMLPETQNYFCSALALSIMCVVHSDMDKE